MSIFDLTLTKKEDICEDVVLLTFSSNIPISSRPGQYLNLYQPENTNGHGGRSYSILRTKDDGSIQFAIRKRGSFSTFLHELEPGCMLVADGPHGMLCPDKQYAKHICIAAGIGAAPFISWSQETNITLLASNPSEDRFPFLDELKENKRVELRSFITKERSPKHTCIQRRISKEDIKDVLDDNCCVAICGSVQFTRDMWKMTKELGVPEEHIYTEAFF